MKYAQALIDIAAEVCGSHYKVAQALGVNRANFYAVRRGERPLPLEWVPELARLAKLDLGEAMTRIVMEKNRTKAKASAQSGYATFWAMVGAATLSGFAVLCGVGASARTMTTDARQLVVNLTSYTSYLLRRLFTRPKQPAF